MKNKITMLAVLLTVFLLEHTQAQTCLLNDSLWQLPETEATAEAKNGFLLPTSGTIRVLVVYVEIDYDVNPQDDPYPNGSNDWQKGQLPNYKDNLFDAEWSGNLQGSVTRYYQQASHGNLQILGDYIDSLFIVKESDAVPGSHNTSIIQNAISQINQWGVLRTKNNMSIADFDNWQDNDVRGAVKIAGPDTPHSFDHVFFVVQNNHTWRNIGSASPGSHPNILGYAQDTKSETSMVSNPTQMFAHEFGHLLFGDNRFHTGGGHAGWGTGKTFIPMQGGWSMMGGFYSSIQTFNAWDRDRMEWKHPAKTYLNSALDENLNEVETELDATNINHSGIYIIRDFVTTGDVLQIKLPNIPSTKFQQYLWIENHQTSSNNGSEFDKFKHQHHACMDEMQPGLYMYMQAGKDIKTGAQTYSQQRGHYTRPIPANGMYDMQFESDSITAQCVAWGKVLPFEKLPIYENPLTGNQDSEIPAVDGDSDNLIGDGDEILLYVEKKNGQYYHNMPYAGTVEHPFTKNGVNKIGMGTNPSANSMITFENDNGPIFGTTNNNKVILNGISVEIVEELPDGSIKVEVKFDDTDITNDARWCGDIVLPAIQGSNGYALNLTSYHTLTLDQGFTATKITNPMSINGVNYFVDPTILTCDSGSYIHLEQHADLHIAGNSTMVLKSGSKLELEDGAELFIHEGELIIEDGAELILHDGAKITVEQDGKLTINNTIAGKGLVVGGSAITANQAAALIKGTLAFAANALWEHKKSGFYAFTNSHTLHLPSTVNVTFAGLHKTHKMLELQSYCELNLSGNTVNWSNGLIHYNVAAQINFSAVYFTGTNLTLNGPANSQPGTIGINATQPTKLHLVSSVVEKFHTGVKISNATISTMLLGNTFTDNIIGIDLDSTSTTTIASNTISSTYQGDIGIKATASFQVTVNNTTILGINKGAYFSEVDGAYFSNCYISYADIGIDAVNTLLFVRNKTEIFQNNTGVKLFGNYNYTTGNYSSMLTVGDLGCGAIYNNSIGVYGRDALLNIDAIEHAINSSTNDTIPNRFDNNSTYTFDICYTDYTVAPSQINAKLNYWGSSVIPPANYRLKTNTDCVAKPNHGTNIPLVTTPHSTCSPTPDCSACKRSGGSSPGGGSGGAIGLLVTNAFQTANEPFVEEDNAATRQGFNDISSVGLIKDTTNQTWQAVTINNDLLPIDRNSVHRIQVSKAIHAKATNGNMRLTNAPKDIFAGLTNNNEKLDTDIQVYPNPTSNQLFVSHQLNSSENAVYLEIMDVTGRVLTNNPINQSTNEINIKHLPSGLYFYHVTQNDLLIQSGKIVIE